MNNTPKRASEATVAASNSEQVTTDEQVRPCPAEQQRREQAHRDLLALDVFRNSTAPEEYRPS